MTSIRAVISAGENGISDRRIEKLLIDKGKQKSKAKEIGWLKFKSGEMGFGIEFVEAEELDKLTTGSTHGGIIALCSGRTIPSLGDSEIKADGFYALLEGIEDPYNFGYAIRSLYACGVDGNCAFPQKLAQCGREWFVVLWQGTSEMLPCFISDGVEGARYFKSRGYKVVCAGIRDSVSSFDCDMTRPVFLIVGGEKRGISSALLDKADCIVRIDYDRQFGGSLSAASAASSLLTR